MIARKRHFFVITNELKYYYLYEMNEQKSYFGLNKRFIFFLKFDGIKCLLRSY
jgi:hypothetical protein